MTFVIWTGQFPAVNNLFVKERKPSILCNERSTMFDHNRIPFRRFDHRTHVTFIFHSINSTQITQMLHMTVWDRNLVPFWCNRRSFLPRWDADVKSFYLTCKTKETFKSFLYTWSLHLDGFYSLYIVDGQNLTSRPVLILHHFKPLS